MAYAPVDSLMEIWVIYSSVCPLTHIAQGFLKAYSPVPLVDIEMLNLVCSDINVRFILQEAVKLFPKFSFCNFNLF